MCSFLKACHSWAVIQTLIALGILFLCVGYGIAAVIKAWRSGSSLDRNIDVAIRDARRRAFERGRYEE
jgi:hypothetical protein